MFTINLSKIKNPNKLEFHNKIYAEYLKEWRANVKLAKSNTNSKDDNDIKRPLTSYDKLVLSYMYIVEKISDQDLERLCKEYNTFDLIPLKNLEKISETIDSKKLDKQVSVQFIKDKVLPTLLKNNALQNMLKSQTFKPWLGKRFVGSYTPSRFSRKVEIQFNFETADYTLLAISFKNMSSLIDERLKKALSDVDKPENNKTKRKSFGIEELDALSKRLKEVTQDRQKSPVSIAQIFQAYTANGYRVWNSLARGDTRLSSRALNLVTVSPIEEIDTFLLNLCYLDDMNVALNSGLVELKPSRSEMADDVYLYRGVNIGGTLRWFKITLPPMEPHAKQNDIKKSLAAEINNRIRKGEFIVSDGAPMSTTYYKGVAEKFSRGFSGNNNVVVYIKAPGNKFKGVDMSPYSVYQQEQEVLLPAGVKLKITACEYDETDKNSPVKVNALVVSDWSDLNAEKK